MPEKITEISLARAEAREDVRDALAPFMSRAHLGDQRAVVVVGIRTDGAADVHAVADEADIDRLIGLLERAKAKLLSE